MGWLNRLLFPPKCVLCGKLLDSCEQALCRDCRIHGPSCPPGRKKLPFLDGWTAVWYYEETARRSLLKYKFYGRRAYARQYAKLLAEKLRQEHPDGFDCLTWVPISTLRKLRRGFDQVKLISKYLGKELGMKPVRFLRKIRHNRPQSGITGEAHRRANVLGAYRCVNEELFRGKRVLLLDDIITTGSTVGECARVLLTAGCGEVYAGAVAIAGHRTKDK